jgi:hypothetical protein
VFAVAGLGAAVGVATAVVYGVLVLVATLPGAALLVAAWLRRNSRAGEAQVIGRGRVGSHRRPAAGPVLRGAARG